MTAQLAAATLLGLATLGILAALADYWAGRSIARHVEAAFDHHADEALALTVPRIDPRTVFQQTLDAMPAAAGVVELGGEAR